MSLFLLTYFVGFDDIEPAKPRPLPQALQISIFAFLWRNAVHVADSYNFPPERTIVIGKRIQM